MGAHGGRWGSALLLVAAAVVLLRPWDAGSSDSADAQPPATSRGTVVRAVDGDTLEVRLDGAEEAEDVRLIGVDTPETVKPDTPVQCFGPQASAFEHRVVEGRRVRLWSGSNRGTSTAACSPTSGCCPSPAAVGFPITRNEPPNVSVSSTPSCSVAGSPGR